MSAEILHISWKSRGEEVGQGEFKSLGFGLKSPNLYRLSRNLVPSSLPNFAKIGPGVLPCGARNLKIDPLFMKIYKSVGFPVGINRLALFSFRSQTATTHSPYKVATTSIGYSRPIQVQKIGIFLYSLWLRQILTNFNFFHYQNEEKSCNNTITKDPTAPQVCRYTTSLWNVCVLKATTENKTF